MLKSILFLGLAAGGAALAACADRPYYAGPPPGHVRWCLGHHPGYDPNSNLFPGPDGRLHVCRFHPEGFYGPPPPVVVGPPLPPPPPPPPRY